jgi:hypothetical protein
MEKWKHTWAQTMLEVVWALFCALKMTALAALQLLVLLVGGIEQC